MSRIATLESQRVLAVEKAEGITALADQEGRDLTAAEEREFNANLAAAKRLAAQVAKAKRQDAELAGYSASQRRTAPDVPGRANLHHQNDYPGRKTGRVPATLKGPQNGGFESLGEFALAVRNAGQQGGYVDPRLQQLAPTTWAGEGSGGEGGYVVPPDFRSDIMAKVMGEESLLAMTDQIPISGNSIIIPKDNSVPWGTTGVRASWLAEAGLKPQTAPVLETMTLRLGKVACLVPITDELLEDAPAMDAYLRRKVGEALDFAISLAIIQGTGVGGQPLGILNSSALVSVAKETSQVADTLVANNVVKMYSRMYAPSRSRAVWLVNQSIEPFLFTMSQPGRDNTGAAVTGWGFPVYTPAGAFSDNPYASLFGRPVIPTQATNELGDKGDILFADLQQYVTAVKNGGNPKIDVSIHLWFDYDVTAFRAVIRMTGAPWWDAPILPRDGSNTLSPFVTLDERG